MCLTSSFRYDRAQRLENTHVFLRTTWNINNNSPTN